MRKKGKQKRKTRKELYEQAKSYNKKHPIDEWDELRLLTLFNLLTNDYLFERYICTKKQPLNLNMKKPKGC